MRVQRLNPQTPLKPLFETLRVSHEGARILEQKAHTHLIYIEGLKTPAANILKQDALSIGADVAVPEDTITCARPKVDLVLMGTTRQIKTLIHKEKAQPFGLKELSSQLSILLTPSPHAWEIMGVVNANSDSFYAHSRFVGEAALETMERMIEEGASIIDLGGLSSRPGSDPIPEEEELARLKPIIDLIDAKGLYNKARFSLDSYAPLCLHYALERGFSIVNDITALGDDTVAMLAASHGATVVLMHMQGTPKQMQHSPYYDNVVLSVDHFFEERIAKAQRFGIEKIILDTGIGFGKTLEHNLQLIQHHAHFLRFGYPLLVGASRKSLIHAISPSTVEERLPGSIALHVKAYEHGATILRVHDVKEHVQALRVAQALREVW